MKSAKEITAEYDLLKVLLVGPPGTGKSVCASSFPTPGYVFDFSNGMLIYRGLDFYYETFGTTADQWIIFEKTLREVTKEVEAGNLSTVIVDDLTGMQAVAMARAMQIDPKRSSVNGPLWNVHFQMVRYLMEGQLRKIIDLQCNVVLIAHMNIDRDDDGSIVNVGPLLTGQLPTVISGYFDEVYYTSTRKEGDKLKFLLQTVPIGMKNARSRLSGKQRLLPDFVPNDYAEIVKHLKRKGETK